MRVEDLKPTSWSAVVGQDRPIRVLHAVIRNQHVMTNGFIFEGSLGVGKTSTAYLFAKALLCLQANPLECTGCPSCDTPLEENPDFKEVDAADHSGVAHARTLIENSKAHPCIAKRLVLMIDEAHNLSDEAWDTFLKPLESNHTDVAYIFVSNEGGKIPEDIVSRCTILPFLPVDDATMLGLLVRTAEKNFIPFDLDGLKFIRWLAKGRVRNALGMLITAASVGRITVDLCKSVLNYDAEDYSYRIYAALLVEQDLAKAVGICQEMAIRMGTSKTVDSLFSYLAREAFKESSIFASRFRSIHEATSVFIKWSGPSNLPSDVLALMLLELDSLRSKIEVKQEKAVAKIDLPKVSQDPDLEVLSESDFVALSKGNK